MSEPISLAVEEIIKGISEADEIEILEYNFDPCFQKLRDMTEEITRLRAKLAEAEGQDVLYVVLDTNTGRPESEFVEIENAEGFSVEVFSVIDSGGFRRIGPLYTHPAPAKVPDLSFASYLIDNCEGEIVAEENIQRWVNAMLKSQGGE